MGVALLSVALLSVSAKKIPEAKCSAQIKSPAVFVICLK